jgi:5'-nucleotidase
MKILLTNDDGYEAGGIIALQKAFKEAGHEVLTVAPAHDQSGQSHAMTIARNLQIKELGENLWICSGTPVDCVICVAAGAIDFIPDLVVSGINAGANLGTDIVYSGTAAAARQAALNGCPGIAFSLVGEQPFLFDVAAKWAARRLEELRALWEDGVFINVNMPNREEISDNIELSFPARRKYIERMEVENGEDGWKSLHLKTFDVETRAGKGADYTYMAMKKAAVSRVYVHPVVIEDVKKRSLEPRGKVRKTG